MSAVSPKEIEEALRKANEIIIIDAGTETCEVCGKEIPEGAGDEFLDKSCGYRFWLCDECIEKGDMY